MQIKIEKRYIATIISVILLLAFAGYVIAVTGVSHTIDELPSIPWSKLTNVPPGLDDGDDVGGIEGGAVIWVGNVGKILKDGANTPEISCQQSHYPYNRYYYGQAKIENGKIYIRARVSIPGGAISCSSGWVQGTTAQCTSQYGDKSVAEVDTYGIVVKGYTVDYYGRATSECTKSGQWT